MCGVKSWWDWNPRSRDPRSSITVNSRLARRLTVVVVAAAAVSRASRACGIAALISSSRSPPRPWAQHFVDVSQLLLLLQLLLLFLLLRLRTVFSLRVVRLLTVARNRARRGAAMRDHAARRCVRTCMLHACMMTRGRQGAEPRGVAGGRALPLAGGRSGRPAGAAGGRGALVHSDTGRRDKAVFSRFCSTYCKAPTLSIAPT